MLSSRSTWLSFLVLLVACTPQTAAPPTRDEPRHRADPMELLALEFPREHLAEVAARIDSRNPWQTTRVLFVARSIASTERNAELPDGCESIPVWRAMAENAALRPSIRQNAGEIVSLMDCPAHEQLEP